MSAAELKFATNVMTPARTHKQRREAASCNINRTRGPAGRHASDLQAEIAPISGKSEINARLLALAWVP